MLKITLPDKVINTGYGVRYPENEQGILYYKELAEKTGFEILSGSEDDNWFFLELRKPKTDMSLLALFLSHL